MYNLSSETKKPYFAYGSNLNHSDLGDWCKKNDKKYPLNSFIGKAYLPDFELSFNYKSISRDGGALNIVPKKGQLVEGILFDIEPEGWEVLDKKEGNPNYYHRLEVKVLTTEGQMIDAVTYKATPEKTKDYFVEPKEEYVNLVKKGLNEFGLDHRMLLSVAQGKTAPWTVDGLFVYGTLMRGECRHHCLNPENNLSCILLARTRGQLFDLHDYPAMIIDGNIDDWVQGEFIRMKNVDTTITMLDKIEGFHGYNNDKSLYQRVLTEVDVGDGRIRLAWVYKMNTIPKDTSIIPSGDWRISRNCRDPFIDSLTKAHCNGNEQEVIKQLTRRLPWSMEIDTSEVIKSLTPISEAIKRGELSERRLAQETGKWTVVV